MSTRPFVNALAAAGYICLVAVFFHFMQDIPDSEFGVMAPVIALSLLTFSATLMGYLFLFHPVRLLIEHKPREAGTFLASTLTAFLLIVVSIVVLWQCIAAYLE